MIPLKTFGLFFCTKELLFQKRSLWISCWNILWCLCEIPFWWAAVFLPSRSSSLSKATNTPPSSHLLALRPQNDSTKQHKRPFLLRCFPPRVHVYILSKLFFFFSFVIFCLRLPRIRQKHIFFQPGDCIVALVSVLMFPPCLLIHIFFKTIYYLLYQMGSVYCCLDSNIFHYFLFFARVSAQFCKKKKKMQKTWKAEYLSRMWKSSNELVAVKASTPFFNFWTEDLNSGFNCLMTSQPFKIKQLIVYPDLMLLCTSGLPEVWCCCYMDWLVLNEPDCLVSKAAEALVLEPSLMECSHFHTHGSANREFT